MLVKDGKIYKTWNWDFWRNADSRSPEIAGIWGAVVGTLYTIGLAILFAFSYWRRLCNLDGRISWTNR